MDRGDEVIEPFEIRTTRDCGCPPTEVDSLKKGGYLDGPIVSAVLDLSRWKSLEDYSKDVVRVHGKGMAGAIRRAEKARVCVLPFEKSNRLEEWVAIDLSMPIRQGRQMSEGYRKSVAERGGPPAEWKELQPLRCARHWRRCLGSFLPAEKREIAGHEVEDRLCAYMSLIRTDELLIVSQVLGGKEYLPLGVVPAMFLQVLRMVYATATDGQSKAPPIDGIRGVLYGGHSDGSDGLKSFKRRLGFEPRRMVSAVATAAGGTT